MSFPQFGTLVEEEIPPEEEATFPQFGTIVEEEGQEGQKKPFSQYKGGFLDLIRGKAETRPVETLIKKRPSELIRRPAAGIVDLLEALSPSAPSIKRHLGLVKSPAEAIRGERDLTPEEEEAGRQIETLAQLIVPLAPEAKAEQIAETGLKAAIKPAAEATALKAPRIAEKAAVSKLFKPRALKGQIEAISKRLIEDSEKLIGSYKKSRFPIIEEIEKGKPVEKITEKMFNKVTSDAELYGGTVGTPTLKKVLKENIQKFGKARTPAPTQKAATKIARDMLNDLNIKDLTRSELIAQYRSNNKAMKSLVEKMFTEGSQPESLKVYEAANREIANIISKDPETTNLFKHLFKKSNENWAQLRKLDEFESIMKTAYGKEGKLEAAKFANIFKKDKTVRQLNKVFGTQKTNQLKSLSNDLLKADEAIKKITPLNLKDLIVGAPYLLKFLGIPGAKTIGGVLAARKGVEFLYGSYLLRPQGRKLFRAFIGALKAKNTRLIKESALKLENGYQNAIKKKEEN